MNVMLVPIKRGAWLGVVRQVLMVVLMNVPTLSSGLTLAWVSFASGGAGAAAGSQAEAEASAGSLLAPAAVTFLAGAAGVPVAAALLTRGRKIAVIAASSAFVVCWSLKLIGLELSSTDDVTSSWWVVWGRVAGGAGGSAAWLVAPLMASEVCARGLRGAAVAAVVVAHNLGMLLMYLAADLGLAHRTVLWSCLTLSVCHCVVFVFMPESPAYLADRGKTKEALRSLSWLRAADEATIQAELTQLPSQQVYTSPWTLTKELLSCRARRRALLVSGALVVGGEAGGVQAALQFAERLLRGAGGAAPGEGEEARLALVLGAAQLAAAVGALWLVDRVERKRLIVWSGAATSACLCACALLSSGRLARDARVAPAWRARGAGAALAGAVAADAGGLQPASYALLAGLFHYRYRGCALTLVSMVASAGSALELVCWGAAWSSGGPAAALLLAAAATALYAAAAGLLPATGTRDGDGCMCCVQEKANETVCTKC